MKKQFKQSLKYVYDSRSYIYIIIAIFFISFIFGYFNTSKLGMLDEIIKKILENVKDMSGIGLTGYIFWNNLQSAFIGFIFGVVLGIFSIFNAFVNGLLIGYVVSKAVASAGILQTLKLMPHGIFELPAIFIALGMGLRMGMFIFAKDKIKALNEAFINGLKVFVFIIIPLLIIAAVIEGSLIFLFK